MPNPIPPNLDPSRFGYLNPLVFGEYNAAGDLGWRSAISDILGYYQGQEPFDDALFDYGELSEDILNAWKDNLANELVDNDASQLAELILQTLMLVTGETIPGLDPIVPPEEPPPVEIVAPPEPPEVPPREREPFPPVVIPRDPQPPQDREPPPEPPEPPESPVEPPREPPRRPDRDRPGTGGGVVIPPTPPVISPPRTVRPPVERPEPTPTPEEPEVPTSSPRPLEEPVEVVGSEDPDSPPVQIEIDYGALETALYNALVRWTQWTSDNPGGLKMQTDLSPDVTGGEVIQEILSQVDQFAEAGKIIAQDAATPPERSVGNIFTVPGER